LLKSSNPTLLNVTYIKPNKEDGTKESFEVIYKTETGEVYRSEEPPLADIFFVKPEYRNYNYNKPEERMERMEKVRVPISKIRYRIAEEIGEEGQKFISQCCQEKNFSRLNELYAWPYSYGADFQPEYYFMKNWYEKYEIGTPKITTAFLDIECDSLENEIDMDNISVTAYSPVNCATVILDDTKEAWTFILRPRKPSELGKSKEDYIRAYNLYNKQKYDHENLMNNMNDFIDKLHKTFDGKYGYINYHVREFSDEIELIADIFRLINKRKPNFCLCWNMRFDIQYLYYRLQALHINPASIMCHPDFKNSKPKCYFKVDRSTYQLEKQYDYFYCSSYTIYICQMRNYAAIRKSQHKLRSVSLNAIADIELKDKKVDYPEESNMTEFMYNNWPLFILYNVKDVLLQLGIERKTKDTMTYYMRSQANLTPYNKIYRETHLLRNVREQSFNKQGWVQGNNINIIHMRDVDEVEKAFYNNDENEEGNESSFKGAINADPVWNDRIGMKILGIRSNNIFSNPMDYDMGAFYPSIKIASNMDPITLLYKASFVNEEFMSGEFINRSLNQQYVEKDKKGKTRKLDFTGEAVNTYVSGNILTFGVNYLNQPSITEVLAACRKECKRKELV